MKPAPFQKSSYSASSCLEKLRPAIAHFATDEFSLRNDLDELCQVRDVGAVNSTILTCGRILHALAENGLGPLATANVYFNLQLLSRLNLLNGVNLYWLHAIRRSANDARHVRRRLDGRDAELTLLFTERCLDWFFCKLPREDCYPSLTVDGHPLLLTDSETLRTSLQAFDAEDVDAVEFANQTILTSDHVFHYTVVLTALTEKLINLGAFAVADQILSLAEKNCPWDLRITQLRGLYWRRLGNLSKALEQMKPVYAKYSNDEESIGITAAIWKELWVEDDSLTDYLHKAHRAYANGWKRSDKTSTYLGINAAATALWLNESEEAKLAAADVKRTILRTVQSLQGMFPQKEFSLGTIGMWEQLTLAEAQLILGDLDEARQTYSATFRQFAEEKSALEAARKQARKICDHLKLPREDFFIT